MKRILFERRRSVEIKKILSCFDEQILLRQNFYLGGSTAISLMLNEFREPESIQLFCSNVDGFKWLRNEISDGIDPLLKKNVSQIREAVFSASKISTALKIDETLMKVEFVHLFDREVDGSIENVLKFPVLSEVDLFSQKLIENADHYQDKNRLGSDIIDICMMAYQWGGIPEKAWEKSYKIYGEVVLDNFNKAIEMMMDDPNNFKVCLDVLNVGNAREALIEYFGKLLDFGAAGRDEIK